MHRVFNMGVGFCIVTSDDDTDPALAALHDAGVADARVIGRARADRPGEILIPERGLSGTREHGFREETR
jgi:phosphoribosylaminoimidazole (AIR) synthetase